MKHKLKRSGAIFLFLMSQVLWTPQVQADQGISFSIESLFAPLGKTVEQYPESARQSGSSAGANTPATPTDPNADADPDTLPRAQVPGRETTEWLGVSGFFDLNKNWRLLYGAHTTLLTQPLFKLDGGIAFMVEPLDALPVQTYFFAGATPVLSPDPALPSFSMTYQTGVGVNYTWNNVLYTDVRINFYVASLLDEDTDREVNFRWNVGTFSLVASTGFLF